MGPRIDFQMKVSSSLWSFFERLENSSIAIVAVLGPRKVGTGEGNLGLSVHEHYLFKSSWK